MPPDSSMLNILIVDDDEDFGRMLTSALRSSDCTTHFVSSSPEAVKKFSEGQYDLVLTDLEMPELNGVQVAEAIRSSGARTPIVLLTARVADELPEAQIVNLQIDRVLHKPVQLAELRAIRDGLQRRPKQKRAG